MKLNLILASTTALGLIVGCGHALADSNVIYLTQNGTSNTALITQSEVLSAGGNIVGAVGNVANQNGSSNSIKAVQSTGSTLGTSWGTFNYGADYSVYGIPGTNAPYTLGLDQIGNFNNINVNQTRGVIEQIQQSATSPYINNTSNDLQVTQSADYGPVVLYGGLYGNNVGSVHQVYTGTYGGDKNLVTISQSATNAAPQFMHSNNVSSVDQSGTANTVTITQVAGGNYIAGIAQAGSGNTFASTQYGINNLITKAYENGSGNTLTITQSGTDGSNGNEVQQALLSGTGNNLSISQTGAGNKANISITGDYNGVNGFNATTSQILNNSFAGLLDQIGTDNSTNLLVSNADWTSFGFYQNGTSNSIDGSVNAGTGNSVAIYQAGIGNASNFSQTGSYNSFGALQ
jgi:hypothetical protein